jgi:glycosyltransferase involved in cell wall biosynthesis
MKPRVLFVGGFPPPHRRVFGGQVRSCLALVGSSLPTRLDLDLFDTTQISHPPPSAPVRAILAVGRLVRFVVRFERHVPDAVLLFAAIGGSLAEKGLMAWYARLRGVPALMFPRGGVIVDDAARSAWAARWHRVVFGGAAKVLCQSVRWQVFCREVLGMDATDAPVIPNWTASEEFLTIGRHRALRADGPVRLLCLGWVEREKGVFDALEACRTLPPGSFTLEIVGDGSARSAAEVLVREAGLGAYVRFHGWLEGAALRQQLAAADALVFASWAEGLPNVVVEAMAAGLAIVTTRVGSVPDVVTDEREVLMVPPRDPVALGAAIARVVRDPSLRERLGAAAFTRAGSVFGTEPAVDRIVAAVAASLGRPVASGPVPSNSASSL